MTRTERTGIRRNAYHGAAVAIAYAGSRNVSTAELREMRQRLPAGLCRGVDAELTRRQIAAAHGARVVDCDDCGRYGRDPATNHRGNSRKTRTS